MYVLNDYLPPGTPGGGGGGGGGTPINEVYNNVVTLTQSILV